MGARRRPDGPSRWTAPEEAERRRPAHLETRLVDLAFPCHLACRGCDRTPESPRAYHRALRTVLASLRARRADVLRLVFFGGDVFALPRSFEDLLCEAAEEARAQGVTLTCAALSDGTSWTLDQVRRLAALGVSEYHVALDGPRPVQDAARPARKGGSFDRILNSLRWHRDGARVEIRADAALPEAATDELWSALERDGLLDGPNPVTLTFGPRRTCRQHAAMLAAAQPASTD